MNELSGAIQYRPTLFKRIGWKLLTIRHRAEDALVSFLLAIIRLVSGSGNYMVHAEREFAAAGYTPLNQKQEDGPNKWIQQNLFDLLAVFNTQGHSGFSASYCANAFKRLALFEPLAPLTGDDAEWNEVGDGCWQNNRCSHVFKGSDGRAYDINGKVFREPDGGCYTSGDSRVYVTFPYTPQTEYVDVEK